MWVNQAGSRPIAGTSNPPGTPAWGSAWKRATADYYTHQVSMDAHGAHQSYRSNYLDLDPVYRDAYGLPLLRMTFDWQENDIKMNRFMVEKMGKVAQAMNPKAIAVLGKKSVITSIPPLTRPPTSTVAPSWAPTRKPVR